MPSPIRLQEYGVGIFSLIPTKSALKKALKKRYITVNDMTATSATFINGGESIKLTMPKDLDQDNRLVYALEVLFEDEHLALIHKPAGILVSGNSFKTIANALNQNLKPSKLPDATIPQPVHRLDYATTGILLVGKTSSSIRALNKMFADKTVEKTYHTVTIGTMANDSGTISLAIDDKESQSDYKVIESVSSVRFGQLNWVELKPKTGRRHQLRKHLASIGHPILGDKDYGIEGLLLNGKGLYLHAFSLRFIHPFTGETFLLNDKLPKKFKKIFIQDQW
ncbi:RluA family pseudouridine synthase [Roseivirga echinicomitans]|uniref:RluA family pseudouridine synthase n=1 Tax=Roseivirga echinicomitans TaxID=296218 RepID=UPI001FE05727|nr:RluA family pseudouridine synthase [Roseivirga echinicomitans]